MAPGRRRHGLLSAINQALDAPPADLPSRAALIRSYLCYVLGAHPGANRTATFRVIGDLITRDISQETF
jgi:hypothetical protein